MKRAVAVVALILLYGSGYAQAQVGFGLKLSGGPAYVFGGDLNKGLEGWSDLWNYAYDVPWLGRMGGYKPVHWGTGFGVEVQVLIGSRVRIGLGTERLLASRESSLDLVHEAGTDRESWSPRLEAFPVTLNAYYALPAGKASVLFHLGSAFYSARYTDRQHVFFFGADFDETIDMKARGIGFQAGLGLEFPLAGWLGVLVEAKARYAPIRGFAGSSISRGQDGTTAIEGKLWLGEMRDFPHFPLLIVAQNPPADSTFRSVEEAFIGFCGASLSAGFLIRL